MMRIFSATVAMMVMAGSVLVAEGTWFSYGPAGSITCEPAPETGPGGPVQVITFRQNGDPKHDFWCGAGVQWPEGQDANEVSFYAKAGDDYEIGMKVHDSRGQAGQYHFAVEDDWTLVRVRRERPEWLYESAKGTLTDIKKLDFIFNNAHFEAKAVLELRVSGVTPAKVTPRELLNRNWIPAKTPPPVPGYRIETCIHNCWAKPEYGDFRLHHSAANSDLPAVLEIVDNLAKEYGNVGFTTGFCDSDNGRAYVKHIESKGGVALSEFHNNPGPTLEGQDVRAMDFRGSRANGSNSEDMTHPLVLRDVRERVLRAAATGVKGWRSVDYVWWWDGGPIWGYSTAAIARWRENLTETDAGLEIVDGDKTRVVKFWEYFESYNGYRMQPGDAGLRAWEGYLPPPASGSSPALSNCWRLFSMLFHYEWTKFINEAARPAWEKYRCGAQPTLNPEFHDNGTDLYWFLHLAFVRGFCTEWWAGTDCMIPTYYNGRYFDNVARKFGKEIVLLGETGANGNGFMSRPNYWDNMSAYLINYCQSGAVDFKACHDQYWGATWKRMTDPNERAYQAFCSFRSSWCGFLQCRNDRTVKPKTDVLSIRMRPIGGRYESFDRQWNEQSLASALIRLNYLHDGAAFPIEDAFDLNDYKTIVYAPSVPKRGFAEKLRQWLDAADGRTLVTHSHVPARFSAPATDQPDSFIQPGGQEKHFGFEAITESEVKSGALKAHDQVIAATLGDLAGRTLKLKRGLCQTPGGKVLLSLDDTPLVTERACGKGRVIYLHWLAGSAMKERPERRIVDAVMRYLGCRPMAVGPENVYAMAFDRPEGKKAFVIFNAAPRNGEIAVDGGVCGVYQAQDPQAKGTIRLLVGEANRPYTITDMITAEKSSATSDAEGYLPVAYDGWNLKGIYVE